MNYLSIACYVVLMPFLILSGIHLGSPVKLQSGQKSGIRSWLTEALWVIPMLTGFIIANYLPIFSVGFTKLIIVVLPEVIACVVTFLYFWLKKAWQTGEFSQVKKVSSTVAFLLLVATVVWLALY